MADPPVDSAPPEGESGGNPKETRTVEELVVVKDGYYRYIDILFEWCKYMNPWQKIAVKALINGDALTHPDHPLHQAGQDGIELYISTAQGGKQALLFSLKQIEYLQYYIHHYSLADPRVVKDLTNGANTWPEECNFDEVKVDNWIPLPMNVLQSAEIGTIEPIVFPSMGAIKTEMTRISKYNKHVKREAMMMRGTPQEKNHAEAEIDNEREGPGLRRGPMRKSWDKQEIKSDIGNDWGKGWQDEEEKDAGLDKVDPTDDNTLGSTPPSLSNSTDDDNSRSPSSLESRPDTPAEHYHHAQQALLLASQGGLVTALAHRPDSAPEGEPTEAQAKIGRSLFLALDFVTWEKDEQVILEVGWSAVWWQPINPDETTGEFEEMSDKGHYIVQDHLLRARNGEEKPNHRDNYLFGNSLPVKEADLVPTVHRLIANLSKRSGGGPTYIVLHSPKVSDTKSAPEHAKYIQLGVYSVDWVECLRPVASEYPAYADEAGLGQTFIIDTAMLFGNIENGQNGEEPGKTAKSLDDIAYIMFGESAATKPKYTANAGNRASYLTEVFLSIVTGPDLDVLREDHKKSQIPTSPKEDAGQVIVPPKTDREPIREPVTFVRPQVPEDSAEAEAESESEDEDGIKGVYFEDENGELAEYVE